VVHSSCINEQGKRETIKGRHKRKNRHKVENIVSRKEIAIKSKKC
jgi:hypothetical protein